MLVVRQEELDPVIGVFETGLTENIQSDSDEGIDCHKGTDIRASASAPPPLSRPSLYLPSWPVGTQRGLVETRSAVD